MPSSEYNVNIIISTKDKTSAEAKKAAKGLGGLAEAAKAVAVGFAMMKSARAVIELVKLGAEANRQEDALNNLAKAAGTSGGEIIKSIQIASDFTIDRMAAMQTANRALIMDVAETPAQFERLTTVAVALGRAMGVDAVTSIDNFVTAAGRQSRLIADNLGLIVKAEDAYRRYATANNTTVDAMDDAAKKQAFLNEMLRQGELKLKALGDQHADTAVRIEQATAAWKDAKTSVGQLIAEMIDASGVLDDADRAFRNTTEGLEGLRGEVEKTKDSYVPHSRAAQNLSGDYDRMGQKTQEARQETQQMELASRMAARELAMLAAAAEETGEKFGATDEATLEYLESLNETTDAGRDFEAGARGIIQVLQDERRAMMDTAEKTVALAMTYTSYQQDVTKSAEEMTARRTNVEEEHQATMTKLLAEGNAERIAEEQAHYMDARLELDKAEAAQEASQKQSLGRMILAHFDAWVEMNLATDGFTQKEAQFATTLRTKIAKEYGLMTDEGIRQMVRMEQKWAAEMAIMKGEATGFFDYFTQKFNAIPSEKTIRIRYELATPDVPGPGGGIPKQHGGPVKAGWPYIVGERGPELFVPGSAGQIITNTRTTNILRQNTYHAGDMRVMPRSGAGRGVTIINHFGAGSVRSDRDIYRNMELQEKSLRLRGVGAIA